MVVLLTNSFHISLFDPGDEPQRVHYRVQLGLDYQIAMVIHVACSEASYFSSIQTGVPGEEVGSSSLTAPREIPSN